MTAMVLAAGTPPVPECLAAARAVLFDLDGVLLSTSQLHREAWAELFAGWFAEHGIVPAYTEDDYFRLLDGRPRYDGVRAVLASRGVELPWGAPVDPPDADTICGLGNRKNAGFEQALAERGPRLFPDTVAVLLRLLREGKRLAVVSSSRNASAALAAAGIADAFDVVVDGQVAAEQRLAGKPAPDTFVHAAAELAVPVDQAVVVEDATFGVAAGRAGGFGLVVGVDRGAGAEALLAAGADAVVGSLAELVDPAAGGR